MKFVKKSGINKTHQIDGSIQGISISYLRILGFINYLVNKEIYIIHI